MDQASKNKWQVRGAAVALFLLGCAAGALALNAYQARRFGPGLWGGPDRFEQMSRRLQLTPEQRPQVEKILADTREQLLALRRESAPRVGEIRRQADERLQQVLTPEQWQQFRQIRGEMRGPARRGRRGRGDESRPPEGR